MGHRRRNGALPKKAEDRVRGRIKDHVASAWRELAELDRDVGVDKNGYAFAGLSRKVLAFRTITEAEQADNSTTNRVLAPDAVLNANIGEQIAAGKLPQIGGLQGDLPQEKLPNVPQSKLPAGTLIGKVKAASEVDWGSGRPVPAGKVDAGYDYQDLKNKPALGKYLTRNDVKPSALK